MNRSGKNLTILCIFLALCTSGYALDYDFRTNLSAYYAFNESGGPLVDMLGNFVGTIVGGVDRQANGINTHAYEFTALATEPITVANMDNLFPNDADFTVNFWINTTAQKVGGVDILFGNHDGAGNQGIIALIDDINQTFRWMTRTSGGTLYHVITENSVATGSWVMLTVTFNSTSNNVSIYVNGSFDTSKIALYNTLISTPLVFGNEKSGGIAESYNGSMDEWARWGSVFNQTQVSQLYAGGSGNFYGNSVTEILNVSAQPPEADPMENLTFYAAGDCEFSCTPLDNISYQWTIYENDVPLVSQANFSGATTQNYSYAGNTSLLYILDSSLIFANRGYKIRARSFSKGYYSDWINTSAVNATGVSIDDCSTYQYVALNFTFYNENNRTPMNISSVVGNFQLFELDPQMSRNLTVNYQNIRGFEICISSNDTRQLNSFLSYVGEGDITERYYIINLTVLGDNHPVYLYNFLDDTGLSDLKATLQDETFTPYTGAIAKLQRYFPELNAYLTVQVDRTDDNGDSVFYVYQNTQDYKFVFEDGSEILLITSPIKFICETTTECEQIFIIPQTTTGRFDDLVIQGSYNNDTQIYSITFSDPTNTVQNVRLIVEKQTASVPISVCDTSVSSSSGTIVCNTSGFDGILVSRVFASASPATAQFSQIIEKVVDSLFDVVSSTTDVKKLGTILGVFISFASAGLGTFGAVPVIIFSVVGLIIIYLLQLVSFFTLGIVLGGAAIGIIIAFVIKK